MFYYCFMFIMIFLVAFILLLSCAEVCIPEGLWTGALLKSNKHLTESCLSSVTGWLEFGKLIMGSLSRREARISRGSGGIKMRKKQAMIEQDR